MNLRTLVLTAVLAIPALGRAAEPAPKAAPPEKATGKVTEAECGALGQKILALEVEDMKKNDPEFKAMSKAEQDAAIAMMKSDPELKKMGDGCSEGLTRADYDCLMNSKTKADSDKCMGDEPAPAAKRKKAPKKK